MDFLNSALKLAETLTATPHWGALAFSIIAVLFWTRIGPSVQLSKVAAWLGVVVGCGAHSVINQRVSPAIDRTVNDLVGYISDRLNIVFSYELANVPTVLGQSSGQQFVLLISILLVMFFLGFRNDRESVLATGQGVAIGLALMEGQQVVGPLLINPVDSSMTVPLLKNMFVVAAYIATGLILARSWIDGCYARNFFLAIMFQAALSYMYVPDVLNWPPGVILAVYAALAFLGFLISGSMAMARVR
tara:strand:- start:46 stop:783 length:738 start_codon:yes stop_codon:yes gene_type:complete